MKIITMHVYCVIMHRGSFDIPVQRVTFTIKRAKRREISLSLQKKRRVCAVPLPRAM